MLKQASHVMLYVKDVARAIQWYEDQLGFSVRGNYAPHYAMLWHEGMKFRIDLHPDRAGTNVGHGAEIYFQTDALDADAATFKSKGIEVTEPKSEDGGAIRFCHIKDSEGNSLGLWEEVRK